MKAVSKDAQADVSMYAVPASTSFPPVPHGYDLGDHCTFCNSFVGISCNCVDPWVLRQPSIFKDKVREDLLKVNGLSVDVMDQILARYSSGVETGRAISGEPGFNPEFDLCSICGGAEVLTYPEHGETRNELSECEGGCGRIIHAGCAKLGHLCPDCPTVGCCVDESSHSEDA